MEIVPGPDFPTGGIDPRPQPASARPTRPAAARSSCGRRAAIEEIRKDREAIIVTEIPYQVNKATLMERIAELVREKRSRASPMCATRATARACASSSS